MTYQSGNLDMGIVYEYFTMHQGPQAGSVIGASAAAYPAGSTTFTVAQTPTADATYEDGSVYLKYFNGRFFLNAEVAWLRANRHLQHPLVMDGTPTWGGGGVITGAGPNVPVDPGDGLGSPYAPYDAEVWKMLAETGVVCGPTKLSLFYSRTPGPDRRQGIWINKQSFENIAGGLFLGNPSVYKPYSFLMGYQYRIGAECHRLKWRRFLHGCRGLRRQVGLRCGRKLERIQQLCVC